MYAWYYKVMLSLKIVNATAARNNFYRLLKSVSAGEQVFIENTETGEQFELIKATIPSKKDKVEIAKKMGAVGLKALPIEQIKAILNTKSDISLEWIFI